MQKQGDNLLKFKILFTFFFFFAIKSFAQEIGSLDGPFSISGKICCFKKGFGINIALYSSPENFKIRKFTKAFKIKKEKITADTISYAFHGVKEGNYIIVAYQDINGDKKVNTNFAGIPTEPYLFYKPAPLIGWPSFSGSKFSVKKDISDADLKFNICK